MKSLNKNIKNIITLRGGVRESLRNYQGGFSQSLRSLTEGGRGVQKSEKMPYVINERPHKWKYNQTNQCNLHFKPIFKKSLLYYVRWESIVVVTSVSVMHWRFGRVWLASQSPVKWIEESVLSRSWCWRRCCHCTGENLVWLQEFKKKLSNQFV